MQYHGTTVLLALALVYPCSAGCPRGWTRYDGVCFIFPRAKLTWIDANHHCRKLHPRATVAVAKTARLWNYVKSKLPKTYWLGMTDRVTQGRWLWEDGTVARNIRWYSGEPNDKSHLEDCGLILNGRLVDAECHTRRFLERFACSVPPGASSAPHQWYNACPDGWLRVKDACYIVNSTNACSIGRARKLCKGMGKSARLADFDASNAELFKPIVHAKPKEVFRLRSNKVLVIGQPSPSAGGDSCDADQCPGALCSRRMCLRPRCPKPAREFLGRCNQLIGTKLSRHEAQQACRRLHPAAHLATVRSQAENDFLLTVAAPGGIRFPYPAGRKADWMYVWMGVSRSSASHRWRWEDVIGWAVRLWHTSGGVWGTLDASRGRWVGVPANSKLRYPALCQWNMCGHPGERIKP